MFTFGPQLLVGLPQLLRVPKLLRAARSAALLLLRGRVCNTAERGTGHVVFFGSFGVANRVKSGALISWDPQPSGG